MHHHEHCDSLEVEINRFADVLETAPLDSAVASCPGWLVKDLAEHLGTVHRWAEHLVRALAPERVPRDEMDLDRGPVTAEWVRAGGSQLISTLRLGDPNAQMWAWGEDQHLRFWSRRQLHETLVHRMDLELATGVPPLAQPDIAADAIDEFLVNLASAARFSPGVKTLRGSGQLLRLSAIDQEREWTIQLIPDGFELASSNRTPDVEILGSAAKILLVLYRRLPSSIDAVKILGDRELIQFWLAHSALG